MELVSGHGQIPQAELLKLQKNGQFPNEPVRIKGAQIHYVNIDVLAISDIKKIELEGRLL